MTPPAGRVEAIHLTEGEGRPMRAVSRIRLIAGIGLEGDRYATGRGHFSPMPGTGRALTLIEAEVLESLDVASRKPDELLAEMIELHMENVAVAALASFLRRGNNPDDAKVKLDDPFSFLFNALVGRRFRVGAVLCEGMRLCEPCAYLESLLEKSLLQPLLHRGGLRADVLADGEIRVGDSVRVLGTDADTPPA